MGKGTWPSEALPHRRPQISTRRQCWDPEPGALGRQRKKPLTSHARLLLGDVGLEAQAEAGLTAQAAMGTVVHQEEG